MGIRFLLCFFFLLRSLCAEEELHHDVIVLPSGTVYNGDYFAAGDSVEISGVVNGDVYLFAEQAVIDGIVNGDVLGCGGSFDISGRVKNNCRLLAGQVLISGDIGNNVTAVGGNVQLLSSATVAGSVVTTAGNVDLAANIGSNVTAIASNLRLSSQIKNNLLAYVGQLRITSRADIGGNVDYRSNTTAWIESGATIRGEVIHHPSFVRELVEGTWIQGVLVGSKVIALLMNFLYTFVVGVILIKMFPGNLESSLHILRTHPWKALSYGLMLLILLPLASLILLMTILGVPFALTLIAANLIGLYTAKIYSILWASNWIFGKAKLRTNRTPILCLGLLLYFLLTAIPVFGTILALVSMLFGLGAGVLAQAKRIV